MTRARADRHALQPLLAEFTDTCRRNELTTLGIPITLDKITARWQACLDSDETVLSKAYLPAEWVFAADPEDRGVTEAWYTDQKYYEAAARLAAPAAEGRRPPAGLGKGLSRLHINRGVGWEQQGFAGLDGYGWYFQNLEVPEALAGRTHLYLYFRGVNEQAWVYVNGELAGERSYTSTGQGVGDLVGAPFSFDAKRWLKPSAQNEVAVRVTHATGLGGISMPAMLVGTDEECSTEQLDAYRY